MQCVGGGLGGGAWMYRGGGHARTCRAREDYRARRVRMAASRAATASATSLRSMPCRARMASSRPRSTCGGTEPGRKPEGCRGATGPEEAGAGAGREGGAYGAGAGGATGAAGATGATGV